MWLYGIVETSIGIVIEVNLAIDVAAPHHVFGHVESYGVADLHAACHVARRCCLLLLLLLYLLRLLYAALLGLSHGSEE